MRWKSIEELYNFPLALHYVYLCVTLYCRAIAAAVYTAAHLQCSLRPLGYFGSNFLVRCRNEVIQDAL